MEAVFLNALDGLVLLGVAWTKMTSVTSLGRLSHSIRVFFMASAASTATFSLPHQVSVPVALDTKIDAACYKWELME